MESGFSRCRRDLLQESDQIFADLTGWTTQLVRSLVRQTGFTSLQGIRCQGHIAQTQHPPQQIGVSALQLNHVASPYPLATTNPGLTMHTL